MRYHSLGLDVLDLVEILLTLSNAKLLYNHPEGVRIAGVDEAIDKIRVPLLKLIKEI